MDYNHSNGLFLGLWGLLELDLDVLKKWPKYPDASSMLIKICLEKSTKDQHILYIFLPLWITNPHTLDDLDIL